MDFPHPLYRQIVLEPAYADASRYLFAPMLAANRAHIGMLAEQGIVTNTCAGAVLEALNQIEAEGLAALPYQPELGIEDLFFAVERRVIGLAGEAHGGNLQLARSRNDLGAALGRMALRDILQKTLTGLRSLRAVIVDQAERHVHTLMPGHTHTQPAQPSVFGHYLLAIASGLLRDERRFEQALSCVNQSPLGAAAFTTTGFPVNRARIAEMLHFDGVMLNSHDAIGAADHYLQSASCAQIVASTLTRFCHDLLMLCTREFGALTVDNSFIQISSIMPQKRNPVVLEHLRARLATVYGGAQTLFVQAHNVFYGDTQDIEDEMLAPLFRLFETLGDCLHLLSATVQSMQVNVAVLANRAGEGFTTATELADTLVRDFGLPFRTAHHVVASLIKRCVAENISPTHVTAQHVHEALDAALHLDGIPNPKLAIDDAWVQRTLDPAHFVAMRKIAGGVAEQPMREMLNLLRGNVN
jgi:argininosuccinate lyase